MIDKLASLPPYIKSVALDKATELPFSGCFINPPRKPGTYLCRRCGLGLWESTSQFSSHCGWPSFDERLGVNVTEQIDEDGLRIEIICSRCLSHLGHVFRGEGFTNKNHRDCVNSVVLDFVPYIGIKDSEEVIIGSANLIEIEQPGVLYSARGEMKDPPTTATRILFDPKKISSIDLFQSFAQSKTQNLIFFYYDDRQRQDANLIIQAYKNQDLTPDIQALAVTTFWPQNN